MVVGAFSSAARTNSQSSECSSWRFLKHDVYPLLLALRDHIASQLGYSTSREKSTGKGGKIDVVLEKAARAIACEIAITTTIDHEVGNVSKCLNAGFQHIAVVSPSADRLDKIADAVRGCVSQEEAARVVFLHPDDFIAHLQDLAIQDSFQPSVVTPNEKQYGKYKVKSGVVHLTQDEIKAREAGIFGLIAETMRKKT